MENTLNKQESEGLSKKIVLYIKNCFLFPRKKYSQTEWSVMLVALFLFAIGIAYLYSISAYTVLINTSNSALLDPTKKIDIFDTVKTQLLFGIVGIGMMFIASYISPNAYRALAYVIFVFMTFALTGLFISGISSGKEFARSFPLGSISIQPSEIAKLSLIFFLAISAEQDYYRLNDVNVPRKKTSLPYKANEKHSDLTSFLRRNLFLVIYTGEEIYNPAKAGINSLKSTLKMLSATGMFAALVLLGNHVSGAIVIAVIGIVMILLSYSNAKVKMFILAIVAVVACFFAFLYINHEIFENISTFNIGSMVSKIYSRFNVSDNAQAQNAVIAIGRGGLTGVGYGQSMMKRFYVPVAESDMIFSIICEEGGLLMATFICFLYGVFTYSAIKVMNSCNRLRDRYIIIGIITHFLFQVIVHIGVNLKILPNTGMVLPFISKGGSSLLIQFTEVGIIMAIARKNYAEGRRSK